MAIMIKSPGFGPAYWKNGPIADAHPMDLRWDGDSSFEIYELNTFTKNMSITSIGSGKKTRGWNFTITIENNTDPSNVFITNGSGTLSTPGTHNFSVTFPTTSFLANGSIAYPSTTELQNKFGPISANYLDTLKYNTLLRNSSVLPTAYRNVLVESIVESTQPSYPRNFDSVIPENNKFAIVFKIVRTEISAPAFIKTDYRVLYIKFAPLIDIE